MLFKDFIFGLQNHFEKIDNIVTKDLVQLLINNKILLNESDKSVKLKKLYGLIIERHNYKYFPRMGNVVAWCKEINEERQVEPYQRYDWSDMPLENIIKKIEQIRRKAGSESVMSTKEIEFVGKFELLYYAYTDMRAKKIDEARIKGFCESLRQRINKGEQVWYNADKIEDSFLDRLQKYDREEKQTVIGGLL